MEDASHPGPEKIEGVLERIIYRNEENGYGVARFKVKGRKDPISITGTLAAVCAGESLILFGSWTHHPRFGKQFQVDGFENVRPSTGRGIIKYLSSGLIKGIGPKIAEKLVDHFGEETLNVIDDDPAKLLEVPGIGEGRLREIARAWTMQKGIREVMVFLQGYGLGPGYSAKIYRHYGQEAIRLVKENPYRLSEDIFGIGFKTADRMALNLGVQKDSPYRIRAALGHLLEQAAGEGHLCLPYPMLVRRSQEFLDSDERLIGEQVDALARDGRLVIESRRGVIPPGEEEDGRLVYARPLLDAERTVYEYLKALKLHPKREVSIHIPRAVEWAEKDAKIYLEASQREAVTAALSEPVLVITGGPGVGKTTIVRCIARIFSQKNLKLALAAPTGRAARRLKEATGFEASTIHRLLRFNPQTFQFEHDENFPLPCDVLIVDESSMIDVPLMEKLVRAVRPDARLILVGDADQLPSVGPGELLSSLIQCGKFRVVRLTKLFRQEEGGGITLAAHAINAGGIPEFTPPGGEGEIFFIDKPDPEEAARQVVDLVRDRIPSRFGLDPLSDIQVLAPMHKGAAGTESLNRLLQEALNPEGEEVTRYNRTYRVGDKVMQIRNNYTLNVFNGEIGFVDHIDAEEGLLRILMDDRTVEYRFENLDELVHAYCVSVHKSQGSEFPAVVLPLLTQHFILLRRNLLYTGVTRARKLLVLLGAQRALHIAVSNDQTSLRYSLLKERFILDEGLENHNDQ